MKAFRSLLVLTSIFIASCSSEATSTVQVDTTTADAVTPTTSTILVDTTSASSETRARFLSIQRQHQVKP